MLRRLQHPGIARINDAGMLDLGAGAQPFVAMELVEGLPLDRHADEMALSRRERLELLARVRDAVQHAHQKRVMHRDLEPASVLVDAHGQRRVLDFGIARATDARVQAGTVGTQLGEVLGTLPYVSPEQVPGDPAEVDTRTDVCAPGAILYPLLSARLPLAVERWTLTEVARAIREAEPAPLSSHDRRLRGNLDTVVATAREAAEVARDDAGREAGWVRAGRPGGCGPGRACCRTTSWAPRRPSWTRARA